MLHEIHNFVVRRITAASPNVEGVIELDTEDTPSTGHYAALQANEIPFAQSFAQGAEAVLRVGLDVEIRLSDRIGVDDPGWFEGWWEVAAIKDTPKHQRVFLRRVVTDAG